MKKTALVAAAAALLMTSSVSRAADVSLLNNDPGNTSSLNSAGQWSNALPPDPANDYFSSTFFLRTPPSGNVTFAGKSLTLQPPSGQAAPMRSILFKGGNNSVTTINNLTNAGGIINAGSGNVTGIFNGNAMYVVANSTIQADQGPFVIGYPLFGSADLTNTSGQARTITYTNDNSGFNGRFVIVNNVTMAIAHPNGLPSDPATEMLDQITLGTTAILQANTNLTYSNPKGGITLTANASISFVSTGLTMTVSRPITGPGFVLTKRGGGILTLAGDNSGLGGVTLLTFTAGSRLNINHANALGSGVFTLGAGAVAPALLDNTSGSPLTLATTFAGQTWNSSFSFLGSSSLDMAGLGPVTLGQNTTAAVENNTLTVGSLNGAFSLTKAGLGTLIVDGGVNLSGNTTVNGGILKLTGAGELASPVITVASNATLDLSAFTDTFSTGLGLNFAQTLQGAGTVMGTVTDGSSGSTVINPGSSAGTLTITGDLSLLGGTTLNFELTPTPTPGAGFNDLLVVGGALNVSGPTTVNVSGVTASGGVYRLIQYGSFSGSLANFSVPPGYVLTNNTAANAIELIAQHIPVNLTWQGDGALNAWDIGVTANWLHSGTNQYFFNGDVVTFDNSGDNTLPISIPGDVAPGAVTVNASKDYTFSGAGIATGSLTKSGTGTLILDNTNSYSGPTVISGGILQVGDMFGVYGGTVGTLGTGVVTNNSVLQFSRTSALAVPNEIVGSGVVSNLSSSGTVTLSGRLSGSATVGQAGFGMLRLTGSNDYTGVTTVSMGTLSVQSSNALGSAATGTIVEGGTLYFDWNQPFVITGEPVTLNNNATLARGGGQSLLFDGPVSIGAGGGILQVDGGATLTLSNLVSGSGPIQKTQSGTLILAAANTFTGPITATAGTLALADNGALGTAPGVTITSTTGGPGLSGTRVTLMNGVTLPASKSLAMPSSGAGTIRSTLFGTGAGLTNTWAGPITITGDGAPVGEPPNMINIGADNGSTLVLAGNISTDGTFFGKVNLRGTGAGSGATGVGILAGTMTLSADGQIQLDDGSTWIIASTGNTWGTNRVVNGTLRLGANNALPPASAITDNARLDLAGFNQTIAGLNAGCAITNSSATADSTLTYSSGLTSTFTGSFRDGEKKLNVTVAAGILALNNAATLALPKSTVTVNGGATLQLDFAGTNQVFGLVLNGVSQLPGVYSAENAAPYLSGTGYILVQPGPSGPVPIVTSRSGNTLTLSWPAGEGWRLQMQTNSLSAGLGGNWEYVTDGTVNSTNITVDPSSPAVFYRLVYP